jgi:hypothetical protein
MMDVLQGKHSAAQVVSYQKPWVSWALAALISVAAYWLLARSNLSTGTALGDLGDARFNLYILEHTFRYLTGLDSSYQSPDIYFPFPGTLFFSDLHIGSVPFYLLFRSAGASSFTAYTLWILAGHLLTFWVSYYAFLRFGFGPLPAAIAAIVFAFSLPSLAQVGHSQLTYRAGIPLAFLGIWNFLRSGRVRDACLLVIAVAYQFLCSVYLGAFLLLVLGAFAVCLIGLQGLRHFSRLPRQVIQDAGRLPAMALVQFAAMIAALAATAAVLLAHQRWGAMYGLGRHWSEISTMVPRPQSYFLMSPLPRWEGISALIGSDVPMAHEHNLFLGVGAFSLFALGSIVIWFAAAPPDIARLSKAAFLALACLFLCLTMFGNFSLYYYISALPGLNAIRAVSRIGIVLVFPAAIVIAAGIHLMARSRHPRLAAVILFFPIAMVAAEIVRIEKSSFEIAGAETRVETVIKSARERSAGVEKPILFVNQEGEKGYKLHLDAMLAAQQLGWPTVNGYSGAGVPGSDDQPTCATPVRQFEAYQRWSKAHNLGPVIDLQSFRDRLVVVGSPDCRS